VAEFVGAANVLQGADAMAFGAASALMIRPELISLELGPGPALGTPRALGTVREVQFFGSFWRVHVQRSQGATLMADLPVQGALRAPQVGDAARLHWPDTAMHPIGQGQAQQGAP
jgi:putative spermidine/putrescine transport system ATP-binding protein